MIENRKEEIEIGSIQKVKSRGLGYASWMTCGKGGEEGEVFLATPVEKRE